MYNWTRDQLRAIQGGVIGSGEVVHMIWDSIRCDCDGPTAVGIAGQLLDRRGGGQTTSLLQFAQLVTETNRT